MKQYLEHNLNKKSTSPSRLSSSVSIRSKNVSIENSNSSPNPNPKDKFGGLFWGATWPMLMLGQIFGVMPVCGIRSGSILDLHFKWKSKRTFYSLFIAAGLSIHVILLYLSAVKLHNGIRRIGVYIFNTFEILGFYCFLSVASKWQNLMKLWIDVERQLPSFPSAQQKRRFILKIRSMTFGILFVAFIEHIVDFGPQMYFWIVNGDDTLLLINDEKDAPYLFRDGKHFSIFKVIYVRIICIVIGFICSYRDAFVMSIGMALSTQFELFNDELNRTQGEPTSQEQWSLRRVQYTKLRDLVKNVDKTVTHLIFLSFARNLFSICRSIFISLKKITTFFTIEQFSVATFFFISRPLPTFTETVYFWFTLTFVILRTCIVLFSLANIHDKSKEPIEVLYMVPSHLWNSETERFSNEFINDTIALSGLRFFFITRKMLLSVVGTIVTYELVLLQFSLNNSKP